MTRDIFTPLFGMLDVIIYAVLRREGVTPLPLSVYSEGGMVSADEVATENARRFINHFFERKIVGIKAIREVSGLGLKDAKEAFEQVFETYAIDDPRVILMDAKVDITAGRIQDAYEKIDRAQHLLR